jgi:hypothetical protein
MTIAIIAKIAKDSREWTNPHDRLAMLTIQVDLSGFQKKLSADC